MGNRTTVSKILTTALTEKRRVKAYIIWENDMKSVYGGKVDETMYKQTIANADKDIEQLEFLIEKLKEFKNEKDISKN